MMKNNSYHNRDWLAYQYYDLQKSTNEIGKECGVHHSTIQNSMKKWGLKLRTISAATLGKKKSPEHRAKMAGQFGAKSHNWKGGRHHVGGYIGIRVPDHNDYVYEHRTVMEAHIGRALLPTEIVHHINSIRVDNRIDNLMLFPSHSAHRLYHCFEKRG